MDSRSFSRRVSLAALASVALSSRSACLSAHALAAAYCLAVSILGVAFFLLDNILHVRKIRNYKRQPIKMHNL